MLLLISGAPGAERSSGDSIFRLAATASRALCGRSHGIGYADPDPVTAHLGLALLGRKTGNNQG